MSARRERPSSPVGQVSDLTHPRSYLRVITLLIPLVVVAAAAGFWAWRIHVRSETLLASIPPRPALSEFPAELTLRVARAEQSLKRDASAPGALAELAQLYHANGFLPEAVSCYRGLAQLEPRNPRWPHRLACIYAGFGQLDDALTLGQRTVRLDPSYVPAQIRTGDVLLKLNRNSDAAAAYRIVLEREPGHPHALAGLARIDIAAQRWTEARPRLEQAAAKSEGRIGADLLASVYEKLGDTGRAAALRGRVKSAGAFYDLADPWIDEIMDDCFDVYRLAVAAGFADHAGDTNAARHLIERALKLAPENVPALYQSGTFALQRRDYDQAREAFETCTRIAPEFSDGWARLINLHLILGNSAAVERTLYTGLQHCPDSPVLHLERASQLAGAGRHNEAITAIEHALRLRPTDAEALVKLAHVYFRLDRVDDGIAALHRALGAEPEHPPALSTLALHAIGSGDESGAREWLRRVRWQVRISREMADGLADEFRKRFGRAPD